MGNSVLLTKSEDFAVDIINLYKKIVEDKKEFVLSKQVLKSGTSIGANLFEAIFAISDNDFLVKTYISLKESSETLFWLRIIARTDFISQSDYEEYKSKGEEILKMLIATTKTIKNKINQK